MSKLEIKYCGNHSFEDLQNTINSSADYIGIVFAESKRRAEPERVSNWLDHLPLNPRQQLVGLFVNPTIDEIDSVLELVSLDIIQCHGSESKEDLSLIKTSFFLPVWKAIHHDESAIETMREYEGLADGFVIDCKVKGKWGGTGQSFDWRKIPLYLKEARRQHVSCLIAGGIEPDNITELLKYNPDGIDLSSGIEQNGTKNAEIINRLEERIFQYDTRLS